MVRLTVKMIKNFESNESVEEQMNVLENAADHEMSRSDAEVVVSWNGLEITHFQDVDEHIIENRFQEIMQQYRIQLYNGQRQSDYIPLSPKTQYFIKLCLQREFLHEMRAPLGDTSVHWFRWNLTSQHQLKAIRDFFSEHAENHELDLNHEVCFYFYNYALTKDDRSWFRLFIEHGVDVTLFDQASLVHVATTAEKTIMSQLSIYGSRKKAFATLDFSDPSSQANYLVGILGINPYVLGNPLENYEPDTEFRNLPRRIFCLPLYRFFLNKCGYIPIHFNCYYQERGYSLMTENELKALDESRGFIETIIDNDLYFNADVAMVTNDSNANKKRKYTNSHSMNVGEKQTNSLKTKYGFSFFIADSIWSILKFSNFGMFVLQSQRMLLHSLAPLWQSLLVDCHSQVGIDFRLKCLNYLQQAATYRFREVLTTFFDRSKIYHSKINQMANHKFYVNFTMMGARSLSILKYFVEMEHADVNYIHKSGNGETIWMALMTFRNIKEEVSMIQYLCQHVHCVHHNEEVLNSVLKSYLTSCSSPYLEALLHYGYGYEFDSDIRMQRGDAKVGRCTNINDLRLERNTMNPLLFAVVHNLVGALDLTGLLNHLIHHHQADVNARDHEGNTVVIHVVKKSLVDAYYNDFVISLVEQYNADIYLENHKGESAFSLASDSLKHALMNLIDAR
jgi:hypothetical protein